MSETIIVTGGLGAIGSYVCRRIVRAGDRPLIVDTGHDPRLIRDIESDCLIEDLDVANGPGLVDLCLRHRPLAIVHLAFPLAAASDRDPWTALHQGPVATAAVLECARLTGVPRFSYVSSRTVYGQVGKAHTAPPYVPVPESHSREPTTLYGKLKRAAEDLVEHYSRQYGVEAAIFRFASVFGPGQANAAHQPSILSGLIESAFSGSGPARTEAASSPNQYCYTGDCAAGIVAALNAASRPGTCTAYNVASDIFMSQAEVLAGLRPVLPGLADITIDLVSAANPEPESRGYRLCTDKAREELGVSASDLATAVADYQLLSGLLR